MSDIPKRHEVVSTRVYVIGFIASLLLTAMAYGVATRRVGSTWTLIFIIIGLALVQLAVQLVCFLHLSLKPKTRAHLIVLLGMAVVVGILVGGSLWIMANLNYHHGDTRTPSQIDSYIIKDEGVSR